MFEVVAGRLWIGNAFNGRDAKQLFANRIQAVVDLAEEEPPAQLPRELIYCRFPLRDGIGNRADILQIAISTVTSFVQKEITVLVCCSGGMSRSPTIASFALARIGTRSPSEWLNEMNGRMPLDLSPALWNEVQQTVGQARETLDAAT